LTSLAPRGRALLFALAASLIAASASAGAPPPVTVKIDNFVFNPATLTVPVGTTVTWVNQDDIPHTVVSDDKTTFRSKPLDTDDRFAFTFNTPGAFGYFCSIHPHMRGMVVVQAR
jgi:plastocyanin